MVASAIMVRVELDLRRGERAASAQPRWATGADEGKLPLLEETSMIPEESVAYALAAWKRFDESVSDGLLRAVSGAFVLVAAADGELSRSEADRFLEVLRSQSEVFSALDFRALENTFGDLADAMFGDPEGGKRLALQSVARVRGVPDHAELVMSAAKIAADADGRLQPSEEALMGEIRQELGLPEP